MNEFLQAIETFAKGSTIWVYLFIFFGKILEVSFGTLRIVLINRGERTIGSLIAVVEITLWLIVASSVLTGFKEDFLKGIVYAVAFACGNYIGSWLDELLAFGLSSMQVVLPVQVLRADLEMAARATVALPHIQHIADQGLRPGLVADDAVLHGDAFPFLPVASGVSIVSRRRKAGRRTGA